MKPWAVFKKDTEKKPHQMVGSVYAVDAETALLEARTVFARRPKAVSMWAAPMDLVVTLTQQNLAELEVEPTPGVEQTWQVFRKTSERRSMTFVDHIGEVVATSAENAIHTAITQFNDKPALVWTVVPDSAIARSSDDDIESWFNTALDKTYKQQSQYGFGGVRGNKRTTQK